MWFVEKSNTPPYRLTFMSALNQVLNIKDLICCSTHKVTFHLTKDTLGRAMAQVVGRQPLTTETGVCTRVSPCGICGGQSSTGTGFTLSSGFYPINIIPSWLSKLIYHVGKNNKPTGGHSSEM
jgi:hypothetical protein